MCFSINFIRPWLLLPLLVLFCISGLATAALAQQPLPSTSPTTSAANGFLKATPTSGSSPLKVVFETNLGDEGDTRPSASDGSDTMIDFGDGSPRLWSKCSVVPTGPSASAVRCSFVNTQNNQAAPTNEHTYAKPGTYTAKMLSVSPAFCPPGPNCPPAPKELAKVTITVGGAESKPLAEPAIKYNRTSGNVPLKIDFSIALCGKSTFGPGDGSGAVELSASESSAGDCVTQHSHTYQRPGVFRAVFMQQGALVREQIIVVNGQSGSEPPLIESFSGPESLSVGETGTWTIVASAYRGGDDSTDIGYKIDWGESKGLFARVVGNVWGWFGERGFIQKNTFTHAYKKAGDYEITVSARGPKGLSMTKAKVTVRGNTESADGGYLTATPISGRSPLTVKVETNRGDAAAARPSQNGSMDIVLRFGDGSEDVWLKCAGGKNGGNDGICSAPLSFTHTYDQPGTYKIHVLSSKPSCGTGCLEQSYDEVTVKVKTGLLGSVAGFFRGIANAFQNAFDATVKFFGLSGITEREFSSLPEYNTTEYRPGNRSISEIEAIIISTSNEDGFSCDKGQEYHAYVITADSELAISGCAGGTELNDYLTDLAAKLADYHSFERTTAQELAKLPIYFGDATERLDEFVESEVADDKAPGNINLEVRVHDNAGKVVQDWTKANLTIKPTDQLYFRWDASKDYLQCLTFLADNGNYALTRTDPKLLKGNTLEEKYDVNERAGLYSIECARDLNAVDVDVDAINVAIDPNARAVGNLTVSLSPATGLNYGDTVTLKWSAVGITNEQGMFLVLRGSNGDAITSVRIPSPTSGSYAFTLPKSQDTCNQFFSDALGQCGSYGQKYKNLYFEITTFTPKGACLGFCGPNSTDWKKLQTRKSASFSVGGGSTSANGLTITPASGAAPLAVTLTTNNAAVNKKIAECKYSNGFFGPSGNGLTVDWGDGTVEPRASQTNANSGKSCTSAVTKHTYQKDGTYTVKVTSWHPGENDAAVTDWSGTITVKVGKGGTGGASSLKAVPISGAAPLKVSFVFPINVAGTLLFGDGSAKDFKANECYNEKGVTPCKIGDTERGYAHVYEKPGTYNARFVSGCPMVNTGVCSQKAKVESVRITVTNKQLVGVNNLSISPTSGEAPLAVKVAFDLPTPCDGYELRWGDGQQAVRKKSASQQCLQALERVELNHTYAKIGTYQINLNGVLVGTIRVHQSGVGPGDLKVTPASGAAPLAVTLTTNNAAVNKKIAECKYSNGFFGPSGNGLTVDWGDGTVEPRASQTNANSGKSCTSAVTKHTYQKDGTYTVKVTSWHPGENDAAVTDWSGTITVKVGKGGTVSKNQPPVITEIKGPSNLGINQKGTWKVVAFDPENTKLQYKFDWGDKNSIWEKAVKLVTSLTKGGTYVNSTTFTHTYKKSGTYTVKVTIRDKGGKTATKSVTVKVGVAKAMSYEDWLDKMVRPNRSKYPNTWDDPDFRREYEKYKADPEAYKVGGNNSPTNYGAGGYGGTESGSGAFVTAPMQHDGERYGKSVPPGSPDYGGTAPGAHKGFTPDNPNDTKSSTDGRNHF